MTEVSASDVVNVLRQHGVIQVRTGGFGLRGLAGSAAELRKDATNTDSGDPNAITATTASALTGNEFVVLPIVADNTSTTVTVAFNGGSALTIKTASGSAPAVGSLQTGMSLIGAVVGSEFRLLTEEASTSAAVKVTGDQSIAGTKTFTGAVVLPDGTVETAKLADGAATTAKIADNAVTAAKVPDAGLTIAKISGLQAALDGKYSKTETLFLVAQRNGGATEAIGSTLPALQGIVLRGCEKGRLYRIARYQNGSTSGGVAQGIKITSVDERRLYDATTEREEIASSLEPVSEIDAADGNQKFLRYLSSDGNFEAIVIWNTDDLPSSGTAFVSTADGNDGWSHFINPQRYVYRDAVPVALKTLRDRLYNPLTSVRIRFEGDSITAGVGAPGNTITYAEDEFTATEGQTVFTLSSSLEGAEDYDVYLDGVVMDPGDYSRVGDTLTLVSGVSAGTVVLVQENPVFHSLLTRPAVHTSGSFVNRFRLALLQTVFGRVSSYQTSSASETGTGRMYRGTYEYRGYKIVDPTTDPLVTFYNASGQVFDPTIVASGTYDLGHAAKIEGDQSWEFEMIGNIFKFTATNFAYDASQTLDVYVDDVLQEALAVPDTTTVGQEYVVTIGTGFGSHKIKVVNNHTIASASLAAIYLETVQVSKLVQVINNGVSGTTSREWVPGGNSTWGTYVAVDTASAPSGEFHIVALGTNDRSLGYRSTFMANIGSIIDYHQGLGRHVIVLAHMFMDDSKDAPTSPYLYAMADFVEDMRRICAQKNCDFVDIFSLMAIEEMNGSADTVTNITTEIADSDYSDDGLHPNGIGHAFIAAELLKRVFAGA